MPKVGFIGTGSMGSILMRAFVKAGVLDKNRIFASDKISGKVKALESDLGIQGKDNISVAHDSDVIFLCVKPFDVKPVLEGIKAELNSSKLLISIAVGVMISDIESRVRARVVKVIPSVNARVRAGISLVCFGKGTDKDKRFVMEELFGKISKSVEIKEEDFGVCMDLTSCAPAFMAYIMNEFAKAGSRKSQGSLSGQVTENLVKETMLGTARLLTEERMRFEEIVGKVATKGGITEEGIKVLQAELEEPPNIFDKAMNATDLKRKKLKADLEKS